MGLRCSVRNGKCSGRGQGWGGSSETLKRNTEASVDSFALLSTPRAECRRADLSETLPPPSGSSAANSGDYGWRYQPAWVPAAGKHRRGVADRVRKGSRNKGHTGSLGSEEGSTPGPRTVSGEESALPRMKCSGFP